MEVATTEQPVRPTSARAAVSQDLLVPRVHQADLVNLANQVPQDFQEIRVGHHHNHVNQSPHHHANLAHKDHPDPKDLQDPRATQDQMELQASPDPMDHPENRDPRDQRDHPESADLLDPTDHQEKMLQMSHLFQEHQESQVTKAHRDHPDHQADRARMEQSVLRDPREKGAQTASPDPMDSQEHQDLRDLPAGLESAVSAPSTAPSTVEFSSRTEHGVEEEAESDGFRLLTTTTGSIFAAVGVEVISIISIATASTPAPTRSIVLIAI